MVLEIDAMCRVLYPLTIHRVIGSIFRPIALHLLDGIQESRIDCIAIFLVFLTFVNGSNFNYIGLYLIREFSHDAATVASITIVCDKCLAMIGRCRLSLHLNVRRTAGEQQCC